MGSVGRALSHHASPLPKPPIATLIGDCHGSRPTFVPLAAGSQRWCRHVILAAAVYFFCAGILAAQVGAANSEQLRAADPFGFDVGEERRYAIGPPGALQPGESELWIIRLESISGEPPNRRINFRLEHEATRYHRTANVFGRGKLMVFRSSVELIVNEHGFPLRVQYQGNFENSPTQYSQEEVTLSFAEREFEVRNRFSMRFRKFDMSVPSSRLVDPSIPRGVYVSGSENPALYSLILASTAIEEAGDIEYMSLMLSPLATRGRGGVDRPTRERSLSRKRLRFEEFTTGDIGGVEEAALRLRRAAGTRPDIYVRTDGTVLRVDITTRLNMDSAFIRLLRPSEY